MVLRKKREVYRRGLLLGIVRMILWTRKGGIGRWKLTGRERIFGGDCWLNEQAGLRKWRSTYHFAEYSTYFVLKIELLLTMLPNFEREAALKDSAFWWVACLAHRVLWSVHNWWRTWWRLCWKGFQLAKVKFDGDVEGGRKH